MRDKTHFRRAASIAALMVFSALSLAVAGCTTTVPTLGPEEICCPDCAVYVQSDGGFVLAGGTSISFGLPPLWLWLVIILLVIIIILQAFILGRLRRRAGPPKPG